MNKKKGSNANDKVSGSKLFQSVDRHTVIFLVLLVAVTAAVLSPSLSNGITNYDDQLYVTENPLLSGFNVNQTFSEPYAGNYHPLTLLSLSLNFSISGLNPFGYHLTNLLLHLLNTCIVFFLLLKLLNTERVWAFFGALLFSIHPMHVESVAWISERKDVLYALFFLSGLLTYLRYLSDRKLPWIVATFCLFVLSVLSKPAAVVFPVVLVLIDWLKNRKLNLVALNEKVPFLIISIIIGVLTIQAQSGNAIGDFSQYSIIEKVLFASYGLVMYAVKFFVPFKLSAVHPYPDIESLPILYYLTPIIMLALLAVAVWSLKKTKYVFFGIALYVVLLALVLQFVSVGRVIIAERYTYLAYLGLIVILIYGIQQVLEKRFNWKMPISIGSGVFVLMLGMITYGQTKVWKSSETLWTNVIKQYPNDWFAYVGRGNFFMDESEFNKALADYNMAIDLKPAKADPYIGRGNLYKKSGKYKEALADYNKALALDPGNTNVLNDRGSLYFTRRLYDQALEDFDKVIAAKPDQYQTYNNIGSVYSVQGEYERGLEYFNKAIQINPLFADVYLNRAILYTLTDRPTIANRDYKRYFKLAGENPSANGYYWMGQNFVKQGLQQEALSVYNKAIKLSPRTADYYIKRADVYAAMGQKQKEKADRDVALRLLKR